jgi:hypothetical protein
VYEIEHDMLFQKFHQEVIKNFNIIDQKFMNESQRQQRDNMALKTQVDDLRRQLKDQKNYSNPRGADMLEIEKLENKTNRKLMEGQTRTMRSVTDLHEDLNNKINSLQDQISKQLLLIE